ncbi:MAG: SRPBCC family protein [Owenweeksia sp.]|nr:SRPBCC family protein [Owenweeksia sp.]
MTKIESSKVTVNKPAKKLYDELLNFDNFRKVMPESVTKFEAQSDSFTFAMRGIPEVKLVLQETREPQMIRLRSGSSKIDFNLLAHIEPTTENTSLVYFEFTGKFNPMMRMMVEKPLTRFIEDLAEKVKEL